MTDIDSPRVLVVVPGRKVSDIEGLWMAMPEEIRKMVVAAAMDMGAPSSRWRGQSRNRRLSTTASTSPSR